MKTVAWFALVLAALSAAGEVVLTKPGQTAILKCGVNVYSDMLVWLHGNNQIISINGKTGVERKVGKDIKDDIVGRVRVRTTSLEISRVKENDAGKFTCQADGKSHEHTLFVVLVSASPSADLQLGSEATLQCQVKGLMPEYAVQWERPGGSPHITSQVVQLKSVARSDAGAWNCTFSYDKMTYSESLNIKVKDPATPAPAPVTSQDARKPHCINCVTNPPSLLLELSWWMWVVIGVGCLVVVLLMVFVICLCKRIKRKKRKLKKMNIGLQLLTSKQYCQCNRPTAAAKPQQRRRREKPSAPPLSPLLVE